MGQGLWDPRAWPALLTKDLGQAASLREHLSRVLRDEEELARKASLGERRGLVVRRELLAMFLSLKRFQANHPQTVYR